ncbi:MAG: hypothetical protein AAFR51_07695 [Pseudomonadota bacterium]
MNVIFRSAGLCVFAGVAVVWTTVNGEANFEKMVTHYALDAPQIEFTRSCMSSLSLYDKKFRDGAPSYMGCGCMASTMAENATTATPVDYPKMARAFRSVAKYSETNSNKDTDIAGMFSDMTESQGLTYNEAMRAVTDLGKASDVCKSAKLPKTNAVKKTQATAQAPHQPTVMDAPDSGKGCEGLSASSVETLQKIANRDGKTLEQICASVVS